MDITKFSREELCEAYDVLNDWGWYEKFGEKPAGFDEMPDYRRTFIEKVFHVPAKEDYICPLCNAIENVVPRKELLRYHHIHNLGSTIEEFETWWFLESGGCFSGNSFEYFRKLIKHNKTYNTQGDVENGKKEDNDCQSNMTFGEKELHCLSRTLQAFQLEAEQVVDGEMQCMYCKYCFECREEFFKRHKAPYMTLLKKLEQVTGVDIYLPKETMHRDILSSSWIEKHPDLKESFLGMSLEEQMSRLENPDILKYRSE